MKRIKTQVTCYEDTKTIKVKVFAQGKITPLVLLDLAHDLIRKDFQNYTIEDIDVIEKTVVRVEVENNIVKEIEIIQ